MRYSQFIYRELKKKAEEVGFNVDLDFPNNQVFALELGYFLDNDKTYSNRDARYYRELFDTNEPYPAGYKERLRRLR